jgi:hypothetical protein
MKSDGDWLYKHKNIGISSNNNIIMNYGSRSRLVNRQWILIFDPP